MKKIFIISILFFSYLITACSDKVIVEDIRGSKLEDLNNEAGKDSILVIDTRSNYEYKFQHIPHAINIPVKEINNRMNEINDWKEKPIYIYGKSCDESFAAAKLLVKNGCKIIFNAEGIDEYSYKTVTYHCVRGSVFEKMLQEEDIFLVDCRSANHYKEGHIADSLSIPIQNINDRINEIPKDKKILLYCNMGTASARAAQILTTAGYENVYESIDGTLEYNFKLEVPAETE